MVEYWLREQLCRRGVKDSALYARYILSLLRASESDVIPNPSSPTEEDCVQNRTKDAVACLSELVPDGAQLVQNCRALLAASALQHQPPTTRKKQHSGGSYFQTFPALPNSEPTVSTKQVWIDNNTNPGLADESSGRVKLRGVSESKEVATLRNAKRRHYSGPSGDVFQPSVNVGMLTNNLTSNRQTWPYFCVPTVREIVIRPLKNPRGGYSESNKENAAPPMQATTTKPPVKRSAFDSGKPVAFEIGNTPTFSLPKNSWDPFNSPSPVENTIKEQLHTPPYLERKQSQVPGSVQYTVSDMTHFIPISPDTRDTPSLYEPHDVTRYQHYDVLGENEEYVPRFLVVDGCDKGQQTETRSISAPSPSIVDSVYESVFENFVDEPAPIKSSNGSCTDDLLALTTSIWSVDYPLTSADSWPQHLAAH